MEGIHKDVENDALDAIRDLTDPIIAKVMEIQGEVPKEMLEYSETYQYERVNLGWKGPKDAVAIIEELSDHESWGGAWDWDRDWRDALAMMAEETYRNAVISRFSDLMESLNSKINDAEIDGKIVWRLPDLDRPAGVLEWDPNVQRELEAYERKQQRYQEQAWPKIQKQLRKIIETFIKQERP